MWYDALMLVIVAFTTIRGAAKGMAWQLAAIAALVLCFVFATPLSLVVAPAIHLDPPLNRWVAMLGIYLAFSFGCFAVARMLRHWLEALKFEEFDRHLGALFGFLKGATLCLVITFFTVCLSTPSRDYVLHTRSGNLSAKILDHLAMVMPAELDSVLGPYFRRFDDDLHLAGATNSETESSDNPFRGSLGTSDDESFRDRSSAPDQPADESQPPLASSVIDQAVGAIEEKLKDGVKSIVRGALDPDVRNRDQPREGNSQPRTSADSPARPVHDAASDKVAGDALPNLVQAVCDLFSANPQKQQKQRDEIEALLQGIPLPVAAAALRDWQADILGTGDDPDPQTDFGTSLDERLYRQLRASGRSLDDLARPLRERLQQVESESNSR